MIKSAPNHVAYAVCSPLSLLHSHPKRRLRSRHLEGELDVRLRELMTEKELESWREDGEAEGRTWARPRRLRASGRDAKDILREKC